MELPDSPAAQAARWLLDRVAAGAVSDEEIDEHFAAGFVEFVKRERIRGLVEQLSSLGDPVVERVEMPSDVSLDALVQVGDHDFRLQMVVEAEPPHRVTGASFGPSRPSVHEVLDETTPSDVPAGELVRSRMGPPAEELAAGGMVVGVVTGREQEVVTLGGVPEDGIFEIGSITKPFTGVLLSKMAERGEVELEDPVEKYLPEGVSTPPGIRLIDLATHSAGLPRDPPTFEVTDYENPFADFTVEGLYEALSVTELECPVGSRSSYSNFGFGLLGHVLGLAAGDGYEAALTDRVLDPLGMTETFVVAPDAFADRRVQGHGSSGDPVAHWDAGAILGAGGIEASIGDMLRFLCANLGLAETSIDRALEEALLPRLLAGDREWIGLGWHQLETSDDTLVPWHNGGTGGFRSFIGFWPPDVGVVALCNVATEGLLDPAAMAVLGSLGRQSESALPRGQDRRD